MLKSMMLIYGDTGVGKSTTADTSPGPKLSLAADAGSDWLAHTVGTWTPGQDLPDLGPTDTLVCPVTTHEEWQAAIKWLIANDCGPFETIIVDTLDELQDLFKEKVFNFGTVDTWEKEAKGKDARQSWGALYSFMKADMNVLRSFKQRGVANIVILSQVNDTELPHRPDVDGKLLRATLRMADLLGYLRVERTGDKYTRVLDIDIVAGSKGICKSRYPELPGMFKKPGRIVGPNLAKIIEIVNTPKETK